MAASTKPPLESTLADSKLQFAIYSSTGRLVDKRRSAIAPEVLPDYQELRTHANAIKKHAIENLDHYIEEFETNLAAHGGKIVWARDGGEVADAVLKIAKERNARLVVKSK
jgi:L-lactate dehydrogenase complex protein LldF